MQFNIFLIMSCKNVIVMAENDTFVLQLLKINDEQKTKIRKIERDLKVAEVSKLLLIKLMLCQILDDGSYVQFSFWDLVRKK
jgi:hypothetical protein